jgi:hypothetical protein
MSSDADAACVAISLSPCLINELDHRWIKQWYKRRPKHTHEESDHRLNIEWAKRQQTFCAIRRSIILWDTQDFLLESLKEY